MTSAADAMAAAFLRVRAARYRPEGGGVGELAPPLRIRRRSLTSAAAASSWALATEELFLAGAGKEAGKTAGFPTPIFGGARASSVNRPRYSKRTTPRS